MPRVLLTGGSYSARSLIANAQRCLNLYPEANPKQNNPPTAVTYYPRPGEILRGAPPVAEPARGLYTASNGQLYAVCGTSVYSVSPTFAYTKLGSIPMQNRPVSMADNSLTLVLVDGTSNGWTIDLATNAFAPIVDAAFYGSNRVEYMATFLLFARPGTWSFYTSNSLAVTPFNPLYIASKAGRPDPIQTVAVVHQEVWLIGQRSSEVWFLSGAADFPFEEMQGTFIEHGCISPYSVAQNDNSLFWVSQDAQGRGEVLQGSGYRVIKISTHAIDNELMTYNTINDAIGFCYQQEGHNFYVLNFPSANKTWVFDEITREWHERCWIDDNGLEQRQRGVCYANAYNKCLVGDWENGNLYELDLNTYTDNGRPIKYLRSFPHLVEDMKLTRYNELIADVEVGTQDPSQGYFTKGVNRITEQPYQRVTEDGLYRITSPNPLGGPPTQILPMMTLRCSDDRGKTWWTAPQQTFGARGQYKTNVQFNQLGMARDRVFELSWSAPVRTALQSVFVEATRGQK